MLFYTGRVQSAEKWCAERWWTLALSISSSSGAVDSSVQLWNGKCCSLCLRQSTSSHFSWQIQAHMLVKLIQGWKELHFFALPKGDLPNIRQSLLYFTKYFISCWTNCYFCCWNFSLEKAKEKAWRSMKGLFFWHSENGNMSGDVESAGLWALILYCICRNSRLRFLYSSVISLVASWNTTHFRKMI